jgi:hypothetical protein
LVFAERLTPERTRRSTLFERHTVGRLDWDTVARLNRWLELLGRIATVVWVALIATIVRGLDDRLSALAAPAGAVAPRRGAARSGPRSIASRAARDE